ncbi:MAG: type II toxin-antitoxin system HicB family antitoxin [Chloroflexota bacterium]|nr:type II toxin-antitoxin system HicB family antitoxin [Chloroflexota bacterium]
MLLFPGGRGWITASVPALPGCVSQGRDREAALANVRAAMEAWVSEWLSQQRVPPPESLSTVLKGVQEALEIQGEIRDDDQQGVDVDARAPDGAD